MFKLVLLISLVTLSNFWIYWIFSSSFLLGLSLIIETTLLYLITLGKSDKKITILSFIILFSLSSHLLIDHFDRSIFARTTLEQIQIQDRQNYLGKELGRVYQNRFGLAYFNKLNPAINKIASNLSNSLDLNFYFSPGKFLDLEKYPPFFSLIFIAGFILLLLNIKKAILVYLLVSLSTIAITNLDSKIGPVLLFPFISLCLILGLAVVIKLLTYIKAVIPNLLTLLASRSELGSRSRFRDLTQILKLLQDDTGVHK